VLCRRPIAPRRQSLFPLPQPQPHVPVRVGQPVWRDLQTPRPPSAEECELLAALAAATGDPRLLEQVQSCAVVAVCQCGCSSVRLRSDAAPTATGTTSPRSVSGGWNDYFSVAAEGRGPGHEAVAVVLHVVSGFIEELEVFAGNGVAVSGISDLTEPVVD
jgi:hypothetical protein